VPPTIQISWIMVLRLLAIAVSSAMVGVAAVTGFIYFRFRKSEMSLPVRANHLALMSVAVLFPMVSEIMDTLYDIADQRPFYWWGSPMLFLSGAAGTYGLLRLMHFLRTGRE